MLFQRKVQLVLFFPPPYPSNAFSSVAPSRPITLIMKKGKCRHIVR